ncbi:MAG: hypothetical protein EOP38_02885 [Rubrivivax sp.]|nr:MAG: hypothetical protein EOP38_02885 [Rubrivivax sp.]
MSVYKQTITTITEVKTLASHMASLGKIMATSEDGQLYNFIANVVFALQFQFQNSIAKSTPTSLMFHPVPATVQLFEYCKYQNRLKKPEWQILAERHDWTPPPSKI